MSTFDENKIRRDGQGQFANKDAQREEAGQVELDVPRDNPNRTFTEVAARHGIAVETTHDVDDEGYFTNVSTTLTRADGQTFTTDLFPAQLSSNLAKLHQHVDHGRFGSDDAFNEHYARYGGEDQPERFAEARRFEDFVGSDVTHDIENPDNFIDHDTTFTEFGEFTPVADGADERGMVAVRYLTDGDGNRIEVTSQLAISQDDEGRWWNIYRDQQRVTFADGTEGTRELGVGNVDTRTYGTAEQAWAALQDASGSLRYDHQDSSGYFEVIDRDWYEEA